MQLRRLPAKGWFLESRFEERDLAKSLGAWWDRDLKLWRVRMTYGLLTRLSSNEVENVFVDSEAKSAIDRMLSTDYSSITLPDNFKIPPFKHQEKALQFLILKESGALFMDMGTGKTFVAINYMFHRFLENGIQKVLVVCPTSLFDHWDKEIRKYAPTDDYRTVILDGGKKKNIAALNRVHVDGDRLNFYIVNYESVAGRSRRKSVEGVKESKEDRVRSDEIVRAFADLGFDGIVCDESHKIKNHKSLQSMAMKEIAQGSRYRVLLTGTPTTNKIGDLFSQYQFMDDSWFGDNYYKFDARYCIYKKEETRDGRKFKVLVGQKNGEEIEKILASSSFRVKKEDCQDLPPKMYHTRTVKMIPAQASAHASMKKFLHATLEDAGSVVEVNNNLVKTLRLRQITSGFVDKGNGKIHHFDPNPKLAELMDIAEDLIAQGKQFIVWTYFLEDLSIVSETLMQAFDLKVGMIYGDVPREDRTRQIDEFWKKKLDVLVIQEQTGGLGIDLSCCDTNIFFSNTWNYAERDQAESRSHRTGAEKHKSINIIDLVCANSIDRLVMSAFRRKKNLSDYLFENRKALLSGNYE